MDREDLLNRISIDPTICFGKPCIRGHRIWVSLILDLLAGGSTFQDVLENYPGLSKADIRACIAYGAEMSRERYVEIPLENRRWRFNWMKTSANGAHHCFARRPTTWPQSPRSNLPRLPTAN